MNQPPPNSLRIASYNIRKAVGTDRRRRPERILQIIHDLNADIVVLQEADMRLGPRPSALPLDVIQDRTGLTPLGFAKNEVSLGWHGNTILVRPDLEVLGIGHLDLPGLEPRGAIFADLVGEAGRLRIVGMHLGLVRLWRRKQLTAVLSQLAELDQVPTVIAGDFNEWSMTVGLGRLAPHFTIHAPGKSYHSNRPLAALDRIALDDGLILRGGGVVQDQIARKASDHLPIWVDIALR